ncbi:T9SS type A sorting domain-containing protein [Gelatiniphilus marinus]|uniref:T9SS type A sorting domain-containing protein n=1 Tax=Gelatiniphilus marinus TaxID=1759464 RepID=A0ABW5JYB5_9FLAO
MVYNVLSKLVLQDKGAHSIDISQCKSGLYFVEIQTENKAFIKKLIITD